MRKKIIYFEFLAGAGVSVQIIILGLCEIAEVTEFWSLPLQHYSKFFVICLFPSFLFSSYCRTFKLPSQFIFSLLCSFLKTRFCERLSPNNTRVASSVSRSLFASMGYLDNFPPHMNTRFSDVVALSI